MSSLFISVMGISFARPQIYGGIFNLYKNDLPRMGVDRTFVSVSPTDGGGGFAAAAAAAVEPGRTQLVWFEPCTNPTASLVDVHAAVDAVKAADPECLVAVDNTFLTPYALVSEEKYWKICNG